MVLISPDVSVRNGSTGAFATGQVSVPRKLPGLLQNGKSPFVRSRPQYKSFSENDFLVATNENIKNAGTGDQTAAINAFLKWNVSKMPHTCRFKERGG